MTKFSQSGRWDATHILDAIDQRDAHTIAQAIVESEFLLLQVANTDSMDNDLGEHAIAVLTSEMGEVPCLLAFTTQVRAERFAAIHNEGLATESQVDGLLMDGSQMLDYLDTGFAIWIDPHSKDSCHIDPELFADILDDLELEDG